MLSLPRLWTATAAGVVGSLVRTRGIAPDTAAWWRRSCGAGGHAGSVALRCFSVSGSGDDGDGDHSSDDRPTKRAGKRGRKKLKPLERDGADKVDDATEVEAVVTVEGGSRIVDLETDHSAASDAKPDKEEVRGRGMPCVHRFG